MTLLISRPLEKFDATRRCARGGRWQRRGPWPLPLPWGRGNGVAGAAPAARGRNAVDHVEYRRVLDDGAGGGLMAEMDALFNRHGVTAWRWQQDGAKPHSIARTAIGRDTRALIERLAAPVEPWPAHSPDLSPIEQAWSAVEQHRRATESWHDQTSFEAALRRSWSTVITPEYCRKLFGGKGAHYDACARAGGREMCGWGAHARCADA